MVCVVYDVSEEATIEKVRDVLIYPRSLPLVPSLIHQPILCMDTQRMQRWGDSPVTGPISNECFRAPPGATLGAGGL